MTDATKPPRRPWRENIEALTMAIVMAVMLKYFLVEAYKIPTGSMQPTLLGNSETGIFDRILVDKFSYHYRDPERFEVAVFKYPLDRSKSFIKRIVGMPGEHLSIQNGDLFTRADESQPWTILRRSENVQRAVWKRLFEGDARCATWRTLDGTRGWTVTGRAQVSARGDGAVRLPNDNGSVLDNYRDGYPGQMAGKLVRAQQNPGVHPVADLRLTGEVRALPGARAVVVELREGRQLHRFELPGPAAAPDARPRITFQETSTADGAGAEAAAQAAWRLSAGRATEFAVQNVDDQLRLEIDGDVVATLEIPATPNQASSFTLRVEGEGADFEALETWRDIFYTAGTKGREFRIPPGHYVMLGDNTQDSSDSREWLFTSYRWDGPGSNGEFVRGNFFPPSPRDPLNGNPIQVSGDPEGPRVFFRDEWGELHTFLLRPGSLGGQEEAPYVARELVVGRAVLVFWPLWPATGDFGIWRLRFVR
ncbi:MAG: signal peptidase I [Planctomycetes bacterium]|nr:signal peptidase I [Planctomycetota bacterium]